MTTYSSKKSTIALLLICGTVLTGCTLGSPAATPLPTLVATPLPTEEAAVPATPEPASNTSVDSLTLLGSGLLHVPENEAALIQLESGKGQTMIDGKKVTALLMPPYIETEPYGDGSTDIFAFVSLGKEGIEYRTYLVEFMLKGKQLLHSWSAPLGVSTRPTNIALKPVSSGTGFQVIATYVTTVPSLDGTPPANQQKTFRVENHQLVQK